MLNAAPVGRPVDATEAQLAQPLVEASTLASCLVGPRAARQSEGPEHDAVPRSPRPLGVEATAQVVPPSAV